MKSTYLDKTLEILKIMARCELAFAAFYRTCAEIWQEDGEFWLGIEGQERLHADNIEKMAEIISNKYGFFERYRPFNSVAMNTIITGIEDNIVRLKNGKISRSKALFIARDMEQSLLEAKYSEIVTTDDLEYNTLAKEIEDQTEDHKRVIDDKIQKLKHQNK